MSAPSTLARTVHRASRPPKKVHLSIRQLFLSRKHQDLPDNTVIATGVGERAGLCVGLLVGGAEGRSVGGAVGGDVEGAEGHTVAWPSGPVQQSPLPTHAQSQKQPELDDVENSPHRPKQEPV